MKLSGAALSSRCASRVSSLPLVSSSPIDSRPTRGRSTPSTTRAYDAAHHGELQQVLRPALDVGAGVEQHRRPRRVGIAAASAGRSTPGIMPKALCAAITVRASVPGADERAGMAVGDQFRGDADGGARPAAQRQRGRFGDSTPSAHRRPRARRCGRLRAGAAPHITRGSGPTSRTRTSRWRAAARPPRPRRPGHGHRPWHQRLCEAWSSSGPGASATGPTRLHLVVMASRRRRPDLPVAIIAAVRADAMRRRQLLALRARPRARAVSAS